MRATASGRRPRLRAVARELSSHGIDHLLVASAASVRWLTGFSGSAAAVLIGDGRTVLVTDRRYEEQASSELADGLVELQVAEKGVVAGLRRLLGSLGGGTVGFDPAELTVARFRELEAVDGIDWRSTEPIVALLRQRKDATEVKAIRGSLRVVEEALAGALKELRVGMTEREIAARIEARCRQQGAEKMAFDTIVATGPRTALPHAVASDRTVQGDEPLMVDAGCRVDGYCSDITRTVWLGAEPDPEWLELHALVRRAQSAAIGTIRAGAIGSEVDAAARAVMVEGDREDGLRHGTGHGLGLEVHESPRLAPGSDHRLVAGMVVTVEPALYESGRWGVRTEDVVCIDGDGCARLTTLPADPILP